MPASACELVGRVAAMVRVLRQEHPTLTALHLEVLLLVAQGVDCRSALVRATGASEAAIRRVLRTLTGHGYKDGQRVHLSGLALLASTKHPHQQGKQYHLTQGAAELLEFAGLLHHFTTTPTTDDQKIEADQADTG